jgi:DNA-binding CsgD family transcriptional regulator
MLRGDSLYSIPKFSPMPLRKIENPLDNTRTFSVALLDVDARVLWLSLIVPGGDKIIGAPAWAFLPPAEQPNYQAVIMRCLATPGHRERIDVVDIFGVCWRVVLYGTRIGKVRVVVKYRSIPPSIELLTPREKSVCDLISVGKSSKQIAAELGIAVSTIDNLRASAARRIGIPTSALSQWCGAHRDWL